MELSPNMGEISNCDRKSQFQALLNQKRDQAIIGLEYVIEVQISENFHCVLCDEILDLTNVISHLTEYSHRGRYLEKHFPATFKTLSESKNQEQRDDFVEQICKSLESKYGRLSNSVVESTDFSKNQTKYFEEALNSTNFDENMGSSFIELVTETKWEDHSLSSISDEEILSSKSRRSKDHSLSSISDDEDLSTKGGVTKDDSIFSMSDQDYICSSRVWPASNNNKIRDLRDVINAKIITYDYRQERSANNVDENIRRENSTKHPSDDLINVKDMRRSSKRYTSRCPQYEKQSNHNSPKKSRSTKKEPKSRRQSASRRKSSSPSYRSFRSPCQLSKNPYGLSQRTNQCRGPCRSTRSPCRSTRSRCRSTRSTYRSNRSRCRSTRSSCRSTRRRSIRRSSRTSRSTCLATRSSRRTSKSPRRTSRGRSQLRNRNSQQNFPTPKNDRSPIKYFPKKRYSPSTSKSHKKSALPKESRRSDLNSQKSKRLLSFRGSTSSRSKSPKRVHTTIPDALSEMDQEAFFTEADNCDTVTSTSAVPSIEVRNHAEASSPDQVSSKGFRGAVAAKFVKYLTEEGRTDITPMLIKTYTDKYIETVNGMQNDFTDKQGILTCTLVTTSNEGSTDLISSSSSDMLNIEVNKGDLEEDITEHVTEEIHPVADNVFISSHIRKPTKVKLDPYLCSSNLNNFELNILIKKFKDLSDVEKQRVIASLKILERDYPDRFNTLRNNNFHLSELLHAEFGHQAIISIDEN